MADKNPKLICKPTGKGKKSNLLVCTLNIGTQASRHVSEPIEMLMKGTYHKERESLHKWLDILGFAIIAATLLTLAWMLIPRFTPELITVDADIAPSEVITGGASTLTFRFENKSNDTLVDTNVLFTFPEHFALDVIESEDAQEIGHQTFDLGDIAPGGYGFIHVSGTMFGDVGGEQTFTTQLDYNYGEEQMTDTKVIDHVFSPTTSTLALELTLPEHLVAFQLVEGSITYKNTGDVSFPDMAIEPDWPESFTLISANPSMQSDGAFHVSGIDPGEEGIISFSGRLGTQDDSTFSFGPSFIFDDTQYQQERLNDTIDILPPPLTISHAIEESTLQPGENATVTLTYRNDSEHTLSGVELGLTSDVDVFSDDLIFDDAPSVIEPGDSGTLSLSVPVRSYISRSYLSSYENINVTTRSIATFTFTPNGETIETNTTGSSFVSTLTSPLILESFGRYWTANGDQLGRGPIPPIVGETTKYWVFWNISGTTNELANLSIDADLGPGVTLTGRQSVSVGTSIESTNGSVSWSVNTVSPTMTPGNTVIAAAFEVALTPTASQVNSVATLLERAYVSASDNWTDANVQTSSSKITSSLTADTKAAQYGGVVEE
ncbi:hypothetical protein HON52_02865 [Candidatus Uhrbacteria bacterium]|jgi:hypothetical protein|nr:hypothetical protein [Candidatus Uhrbacteria bacterium]